MAGRNGERLSRERELADWQNKIIGHGEEDPEQLLANPGNWRIHPKAQQDALAGAIAEVGYIRSVTVNKRTGHVVDGHLRVTLAMRQGVKSIPVEYVDLTPEEEDEALATIDPIAAMAAADKEKLDALLQDVKSGDAAVQAMLAELAEGAGLYLDKDKPEDPGAQVDKAEELRQKWQTEMGQLWQLGDHRLICGDCTDRMVVERAMDGERAALAVTSPPYGVGKSYEKKGLEGWFATVRPAIANLCAFAKIVVWQLADWYCTGSQFIEPTLAYSIQMFAEQGYKPLWLRIWEKQGTNYGVGPYHLASNKPAQQYEHILAVSAEEEQAAPDGTAFEWIAGFASPRAHRFVRRLSKEEARAWGYSGVWKINTVRANDDHPAMFPLELPERCIKMHSDAGDTILEPFCGSGTTLIACERLGRRGRGIELDPRYVAVTLERWSQMTGKQPELIEGARSASPL